MIYNKEIAKREILIKTHVSSIKTLRAQIEQLKPYSMGVLR